jgi:diaminopimelate decarboxylase/aspartate kinase
MSECKEWWREREEELLVLARQKSPIYVVNEETLNDLLFDLLSIEPVERVYYPVRLNPHPQVLEQIDKLGAGFECASFQEMKQISARFPERDPGMILFIAHHARRGELDHALQAGAHVVVYHSSLLMTRPDLFKGRDIMLGMALGEKPGCSGSHRKNQHPDTPDPLTSGTAGLSGLLKRLDASVKGMYIQLGLHTGHIPSATEAVKWASRRAEAFPEMSVCCFGKDLGISLLPENGLPDIPRTAEGLENAKALCPHVTFWLAVDEIIVSPIGVLLSRATRIDCRDDIQHVEIDVPAPLLIGSEQPGPARETVNLSQSSARENRLTHIAGRGAVPGDPPFTVSRLPDVEAGDVLLMSHMGASPHASLRQHYLKARRICQVPI